MPWLGVGWGWLMMLFWVVVVGLAALFIVYLVKIISRDSVRYEKTSLEREIGSLRERLRENK